MASLNLVEASIEDLQNALISGHLTSVELVAHYLRRISTYDCRNLALNAIPVLNNALFNEAAESDDRRAAGKPVRALEGVPYTIKDSFKVKGMAAAAGSPAFKDLISNQDAFIVETLREAGAVLIGRTNMPAMACGGMQRGIWGRAENPYNPDYLAAAFVSGSSNGSAVSTTSSFAAFGIGAETVSSGRSPASNNALIAYTPSRGWISGRGNWPLYPTCDVPVPHTRTMKDLLCVLDVIAVNDPIEKGDFWREQRFVTIPEPPWWQQDRTIIPQFFHKEIPTSASLSGLRIAVPEMFIGGAAPCGSRTVETSPAVIALWNQACKDLESLGAEVVLVQDFPAMTAYENDALLPENCPRRPADWNAVERGPLIAKAWNDFLIDCGDSKLPNLFAVDTSNIYPDCLRTEAELKFFEKANAIQYHKLKDELSILLGDQFSSPSTSTSIIANLEEAVIALEGMRKHLLEDWLTKLNCHCVVFPAAGDVGASNADSSFESAELAWRNGTYYSNGNRAIRHLGIPTVSVPMGMMSDKRVPVNLTFAGKGYDDVQLLKWAYSYETKTRHRIPPPNTPALYTDIIPLSGPAPSRSCVARPTITIRSSAATLNGGPLPLCIVIEGLITIPATISSLPILDVDIDACRVPSDRIDIKALGPAEDGNAVFSFEICHETNRPAVREGLERTWAPVARDKTMVVIVARAGPGERPAGWFELL